MDINKMIKRSDLDYYIKQPIGYNGHSQGHGWGKKLKTGQQGSDQLAFFALLPGYISTPARARSADFVDNDRT